jgi:hypothetical protein
MPKRMSIVYILVAFFGTLPAFAVDGVTLINQSTVMAAGGFPFGIFQPGSYKLSGNLQVPAETGGIQIFASGVSLDLNGFSITGPITCLGQNCTPHKNDTTGIFYGVSRTVIRNGHISGFDNGIQGEVTSAGEASGTIEDIHLTNIAGFGILTINTLIRHNEIVGNGGFGLGCGECAVIENVVLFNSRGGINLGGGTFSGNVVASNGSRKCLRRCNGGVGPQQHLQRCRVLI